MTAVVVSAAMFPCKEEPTFPLQGVHPYHSLSYTSGDTATDSPVHVGRAGLPMKESPRKESLLSYLTGSFPSLHNLLEGTPQRSGAAGKSSSLTRTGRTLALAVPSSQEKESNKNKHGLTCI